MTTNLSPTSAVASRVATTPADAARWRENAVRNEQAAAEQMLLADLDARIRELRLSIHDSDAPGRYFPTLGEACGAACVDAGEALTDLGRFAPEALEVGA